MAWRKLSGELLQLPILDEIRLKMIEEQNSRLKVCIGTDSQVKGNIIEFATAIVFIREGKGGFIFHNAYQTERKMSLKERMIQEVSDSIQVAYTICPILDEFSIELEVHADINTDPQFKSNVALKEAMGYILGMGYTFKAKPDAFASSYCANKVVK
ncbi:MAG: ribonuclease H-like YkuK family protein [Bacteroidia bacterium]